MVVTAFVWVAGVDGRGRPASIVGAIGCLALLVGEPLARTVMRNANGDPGDRRSPPALVLSLIAAQGALMAVSSRVAGVRHDVGAAVAIVGIVLFCSIVVGACFVTARHSEARAAQRYR